MNDLSKLLTSVAALIGAAAWPAVFLIVIVIFRAEIKDTLGRVSRAIDKLKKAALPGISLELDLLADAEAESDVEKGGKITPRQIEAAARIKIKARGIESQAITDELDRLCLEYDVLRRTLPSGADRTRAMTRVLVKMRSLAPSVAHHIDAYKSSGSPGSRLAAIAIMQMVPQCSDIIWLRDRFLSEQPFIFYHSALALQNVANILETNSDRQHLQKVTREALDILERFKGTPDRNTMTILESLITSLDQQ